MKKRQKHTTTKKPSVHTQTLWQRIYDWVEKYRWLLLILTLTALLRLPSLFEPNRYADEDIYLTLGMAIRRGLVLYRDIHDNKPPLLYMVAAIAGNVTYFRLILLGWNLVNIVAIWEIAKKIISRNWIVILITAFFAILSSIPLTEGNIANGEIFMIMPATVAVWLLLNLRSRKKVSLVGYFLVGFLLAIAFLFKVPVAAECLMLGIWLITSFWEGRQTSWQNLVKACLALGLGFALPVLGTIVYYYLRGAGYAYLHAALLQNVGYVSSWEGGAKPAFYKSGLFQRGVVLMFCTMALVLLRKKIGNYYLLVALWFIGALFGALLSGRPYPHYMIEVLPPLSLLVGVAVNAGILQIMIGGALIILMLFSLKYYQFWRYSSLPYYQNFIEYALGQKSEDSYLRFWGDSVVRNYTVGQYIKERTAPTDRIFVWGTEPAIYTISNRLPVGKYTVSYHISDFHALDETMNALRKSPPKYIVILTNENTSFPELKNYISSVAVLVKTIGEAQVYKVL